MLTTPPSLVFVALVLVCAGLICLSFAAIALRERLRRKRIDKDLDEILDCISEGVVVYDREMRLERCNQRFREIYALTAPALVKGASLRDILRFGVSAGQWPEAVGREEAWIEARLKIQADPHKEMMTQVGGDQWILVRNMRGPTGGTIGVRADVTELEAAKRDAEAKSSAFEDLNNRLKSALDEITFHAHRDALTGLFNRRYFDGFIENGDEAARGELLHILHVDLDYFKIVNDTYGHAAGDEILQNSAEILRSALGPGDFAARTGGDEFVLVMSGSRSKAEWIALSNDLIDRLKRPILFEGHSIGVGASIGVARAERSTVGLRNAVVNADAALYAAKADGRGGARYFSERFAQDQQRQRDDRMALEDALQAGAVFPYYQPLFNADNLACVGAEALARWRHPSGALSTPAEIVEAASRDAVFQSLDHAILSQVCEDYDTLKALGCAPERLAVNVSSVSLGGIPDWPELARAAVTDGVIAFELLESVGLEPQAEASRHQVDLLRDRGLSFDVDDFGAKRASIVNLASIAPRRLKIDKRLVLPAPGSKAHQSMIRAILDMAAALEIEVVAEGVETEEHVQCLRRLGCKTLQGFALARPMPFEEFRAFVQERRERVLA